MKLISSQSLLTLLLLIACGLLTSSVNAAQEEQEDAELINEEPSWWLDRVGRWKTSTALDWTIGSDNPQFVYRQSESHSIMILNDQYLLTRTITDGLEALVIEGFREDIKQFWALSIDSNRTPFTYVSGNEDEAFYTTAYPDMVLTDPVGVYTRRENFIEKNVFQSKGFLREKQFMTTTATQKSNKAKDCLKLFEKSPKKPRRVNESSDKNDQAENYIKEHDFLVKLVGDFKSSDKSLFMTSRRICSGRFLFISIRDKKQKDELRSIYILGVDSTRAVFQMMKVDSETKSPTYYEGLIREDGTSLSFKSLNGEEDGNAAEECLWILNDDKELEQHILKGEVKEIISFSKS
jgi:hypothetical protein